MCFRYDGSTFSSVLNSFVWICLITNRLSSEKKMKAPEAPPSLKSARCVYMPAIDRSLVLLPEVPPNLKRELRGRASEVLYASGPMPAEVLKAWNVNGQ